MQSRVGVERDFARGLARADGAISWRARWSLPAMTFDEALSTLGLDGSCDQAGARRAYLRQLKVHKPERDPAVF